MPEPKTPKQTLFTASGGKRWYLSAALIISAFFPPFLMPALLPSTISAEPVTEEKESATAADSASMWEMKALKFIYASKQACRLYPIIDQAARRHEVETHLIMAIIYAESRYDPNAVSHRGARGLMQLMPKTAESLGVADILDPAQNVEAGVRYFKWLLELLDGDQTLALAAYNAGLGKVRQHNGVPPFSATRSYIEIVSSLYERYKRREQALSAPPEISSVASASW